MDNKILIITSKSAGGSGKHIETLASGLRANKINVHLLYYSAGFHQDEDLEKNFDKVFYFPKRLGINRHLLENVMFLIKLIRSSDYQLLHSHTSVGGFVARLAAFAFSRRRLKSLHTLHAYGADEYTPMPQWAFYHLIEKVLDLATEHYIAPSNFIRDYGIKKRLFGARKCTVIHNALDLSEPLESEINEGLAYRNTLGIAENDVVFLFCGRLEAQKGLDHLIEAFAKLQLVNKRCKLLLVGDGALRQHLVNKVERLGLNNDVIFSGWQVSVNKFYSLCDIFVMSSVWESFGLVFLEAMNHSRPIIATKTQGVPEVVSHNVTGLLCAVGDTEKLSKNMITLANDPVLRNKLGSQGKERLKNKFSFNRFVEEHIQLYQKLLEGKKC